MKIRACMTMAALLLCGSVTMAQVGFTVAPTTAPVGCEIQLALSNDSGTSIGTGACPFTVTDAAGNTVFSPFICILIFINVAPGGEHIFTWDQRDNGGNQVPPGNYTVNFQVPTVGVQSLPLTIGGTAGMGQIGVQRLGTAHNLRLCCPSRPGSLFFAMAALTSTPGQSLAGIGCPQTLPLANDFLFNLILAGDPQVAPFFQNMVGSLDANGVSEAPLLVTPNDPVLAGLSIAMAFVTIDPTFPMGCPISEVSAPTTITLM